MLYILLFIFICFIIGAIISEHNSRYGSETSETVGGVSIYLFAVTFVITIVTVAKYNSIKSTATAQLEVLNAQNEIVLAQIEPLIQQAMNYESNTYKEFKLTPENVIAFGNM